MIYKIHKGRHRAWPLRLGIFRNRTDFNYDVVFHNDCSYSIDAPDQEDINKLFGFSFVRWWKVTFVFLAGLFGNGILGNEHHIDSARFGWRYNLEQDKIEILSYCYVNKKLLTESLGFFEFERTYNARLIILAENSYLLGINGSTNGIVFTHKKQFQYPLGVYFGGNKTAPRTMTITLSKH